jgi:serine/threonine-protein kinase
LAVDPHLIPGFEILGRLASGGVAQVFRARRQSDGLVVALKVTSLADMDPEFRPVERFTREGEILERLNHPALPRIYGFGVTDEQLGWMALELVTGSPLADYRARHAAELLPIFIQIAEALQTVAQEGIVHRDVAPDNVLVEERGARRQARLIDFGAAKDLLAGDAGALTRHGAFLGKLAYASPEQLVGAPPGEQLDFRSDIYSLGMTMYELLTGRPPIAEQGLTQIVDAHLKGRFEPISVPPESGGPATRLVALVTRMTARRRDDRPGSWEEVLAELWRSREEVSPLADALARKRSDAGLAPEPPRPPSVYVSPETGRALSREVLVGRIVLAIGATAFLGSLTFALVYVLRHRPRRVVETVHTEVAPAATRAPVVAAPSPGPSSAPPTRPAPRATTRPKPTARPTAVKPTPRAAPAAEAKGTLDVTLLPSGDLEEVTEESGRVVASRQKLPLKLDVPAGRYRVRISSAALECVKAVNVLVRPGRTTVVRETCVEIK